MSTQTADTYLLLRVATCALERREKKTIWLKSQGLTPHSSEDRQCMEGERNGQMDTMVIFSDYDILGCTES